jgi:hypothetical protein
VGKRLVELAVICSLGRETNEMRKADRDREAREKRDKTTGGSIQSGQPLPKLAAVVPSAKSMSIKSMQKALSCAGSSLKGGAQRVQAGGPAYKV